MFIGEQVQKNKYTRRSKTGVEHTYYRNRVELIFRCDCCNKIFNRFRGKIDPNRINNNVFHVCGNCDAKRFAQRKGQERKAVWDLPASSDLDISKL